MFSVSGAIPIREAEMWRFVREMEGTLPNDTRTSTGEFIEDDKGFPLGSGNLKNGKAFSRRVKKSVNFEQTGKVRGNHLKYWKT